jgi:hypothetical protein
VSVGSWRPLARSAALCDLRWAVGPGAVLCCALWLPASRYRPARSRMQGESWELADEEGYNGVREGEMRGEERAVCRRLAGSSCAGSGA